MDARLIAITPDAERTLIYIARASSPNQDNPEYVRLLRYLIRKGHWSPFEHGSMCVEIITSRGIAQQILRHRSFHFQEFSQRYAKVHEQAFEPIEWRLQGKTDRQSSIEIPQDDLLPKDLTECWNDLLDEIYALYQEALERGVAKESARFMLPLTTQTKLYMTGTVRDWIHYIRLRTQPDTQKEHRLVAEQIKKIFAGEMPTIAEAAFNEG